jgi:hypothetical protein
MENMSRRDERRNQRKFKTEFLKKEVQMAMFGVARISAAQDDYIDWANFRPLGGCFLWAVFLN